MKDPWTKPKGNRTVGGRWGCGKVVAGKWRQLYFNNNKKNKNSYFIDESVIYARLGGHNLFLVHMVSAGWLKWV